MQYIVIKPFNDITGFRIAGEPIELDDARAAKLRVMGLIGGRYEPVKTVELTETKTEELAAIYPESKVYEKKVATKKTAAKKK